MTRNTSPCVPSFHSVTVAPSLVGSLEPPGVARSLAGGPSVYTREMCLPPAAGTALLLPCHDRHDPKRVTPASCDERNGLEVLLRLESEHSVDLWSYTCARTTKRSTVAPTLTATPATPHSAKPATTPRRNRYRPFETATCASPRRGTIAVQAESPLVGLLPGHVPCAPHSSSFRCGVSANGPGLPHGES